jgi:PAS domain S-box-containing protein
MSFWPYLHFFNTLVYLYLAVYILIKNPKALSNRLCAVFLFCFAVWSFSTIFIHNPLCSRDTARTFSNIGSFGWVSFSSFFLWFMLVFSGKTKILKKKWFYLFLLGIPSLFIYAQWTNSLYVNYIKVYYGWKSIIAQSYWPYLYFFYTLVFLGTALLIDVQLIRKTQNLIIKKQAKIIFITFLIGLVSGSLTDIILPLFKIHSVPDIADTSLLIWAFGVFYAMMKYKFLDITPATAASNIISTMYDCLILLDMNGNIVTVNKATLELLGYSEKELKGEPALILFAENGVKNERVKKVAEEGNLKNEDFVFKTKEAQKIPVLFSSSLLKDEAGNNAGIVCAARDISERKKLEEEMLKRKKLEAIGMLAGGIAHDFNNLLSVVIGNLSLVRDEISPRQQKKVYKYLRNAEEASLKAADLAGKFITFSPGGWLKKERVILADLLSDITDTELTATLTGIDKDIPYHVDIDLVPDLLPIHGDERQLKQVVQNLFLNSIEAAPRGENRSVAISVRGENTAMSAQNEFLLKPGKYVKVTIADNGTGIPQKDIEKVFDAYFSTKERSIQKGMGMGLTLCYSIVKKHDGHIIVESGERKGTTVTLYLPALISPP